MCDNDMEVLRKISVLSDRMRKLDDRSWAWYFHYQLYQILMRRLYGGYYVHH